MQGVTSGAVTLTRGQVGSLTGQPVNESESVNDTTPELSPDDDDNESFFFFFFIFVLQN